MRLELTGMPRWRGAGGSGGTLTRRDAAMLTILAWEGPIPRDRIVALMWPDKPSLPAHNSLRQRLFRLRRDTGHELVVNQAVISLAGGVDTDIASPHPDSGELLGSFDYGDSTELDEWVGRARVRWRERRVDAMTGAAARHEADGELAAAIAVTWRIIELAPLGEHGWRRMMRLHYLRGDRSAAIAAFEAFERRLRDDRGASPSVETLELLSLIEQAGTPPAMPRGRMLPTSLFRPPETIGRDRERGLMERAWSQGRAFLLIGPPGIGKSRLLDDFIAEKPGTVMARGRPGDERSPYATASRLLGKVLDQHGCGDLGGLKRELARILPQLGPAPAVEGRQGALWLAVERFLTQAVAGGLSALAVDDIQFADTATIDLLRWLGGSEALGGLRLALATRPPGEAARQQLLDEWHADPLRPERIELAPLSAVDVAVLLRTLALPWPQVGLADALHRHAGGYPLYLLETLKDLLLHGDRDAGMPRPAAVQALIERRLQALPDSAIDLMRVAAVAGNDLTVARAGKMLGKSPLQLVEPWALLEDANVLEGMAFVHDLVRDAALERVPAVVRRALHAALAQQLADDVSAHPGRVAEHWLAAERWDEACRSLIAAGRAAGRAGRLVEQAELLERAAACAHKAGDATTQFTALRMRLEGLQVRLGGQAVLDALPGLAPLVRGARQAAELMHLELAAMTGLGRFGAALPRQAALLEASRPFPDLYVDALGHIGAALSASGRHDEALAAVTEALQRARELVAAGGDESLQARAHRHVSSVLFLSHQYAEGMVEQLAAAEIALRTGDPGHHAQDMMDLASLAAQFGDTPAASDYAMRARASYALLGATGGHVAVFNEIIVGTTAAHFGRLDLALEALTTAAATLGRLEPLGAGAKARCMLAELWLLLGQPKEAIAQFDAEACGLEDVPPIWKLLWHIELARAWRENGEPGEAAACRTVALGVAAELSDPGQSPTLLREWIHGVDPAEALVMLERKRASTPVASGLAHSLRLMAIDAELAMGRVPSVGTTVDAFEEMNLALHTSTHPLYAWGVLDNAFRRQGDASRAHTCVRQRRAWCEAAAAGLPENLRARFLSLYA